MNKKRITGAVVLGLLTAITAAVAYGMGIDPPIGNVFGAFGAIAAVIVVASLVKVSDGLYFSGLIFVFMASPMGSILNLYRSFGPYDKIVHFCSGFLLAALGMLLIELLMKRALVKDGYDAIEAAKKLSVFMIPMIFAACMFSSGGAGIWEIFEFVADKALGGGMQRGMVDTVTDIIAGNIGALVYGIGAIALIKKK